MNETHESRPPQRGIEVKLLDHTKDPIKSLYLAYRVAYSALRPTTIERRIRQERITADQMLDLHRGAHGDRPRLPPRAGLV